MKTPRLKTLLRLVGALTLPFSGLFLLFSCAASMTKAQDPAVPQFLFGLFLLAVSGYLLSGAPHLVRALERRESGRIATTKLLGWLLILLGALVVLFRERIVFPGLERLVGIETIVGRENVVYQPDGNYLFTNPAR
jgi:hypothetical protein